MYLMCAFVHWKKKAFPPTPKSMKPDEQRLGFLGVLSVYVSNTETRGKRYKENGGIKGLATQEHEAFCP